MPNYDSIKEIPLPEVSRICCGIELNFHNDRSDCPFCIGNSSNSLRYYPETNSFYCFRCGIGGSSIEFVAAANKIKKSESWKLILYQFNVKATTPEEEQEIRKLTILESIIETAHSKLTDEARQALREKGYQDETINQMKIGLISIADYDPEHIKEIGINENYNNMILIPGYLNYHLNHFSLWNWKNLEAPDKYIQPAGWKIPLTGKTGENTLIVEGISDMVALIQCGYNAVCLQGAHLTQQLKQELLRLNKTILLLDNDSTGKTAQKLLSIEIFPKALQGNSEFLGAYKDLNALFCKEPEEEFHRVVTEIIASAKDSLEVAYEQLETLKVRDKVEAGKHIFSVLIPLIAKLPAGHKEVETKELSEKVKSLGIGVKDIKKAIVSLEADEPVEEDFVEIMDGTPDIIDQPLAIIQNAVYAITKVWVKNSSDESDHNGHEMIYIVSSKREALPVVEIPEKWKFQVNLKDLPNKDLLLSGKALKAFMEGYTPDIITTFNNMVKVVNTFLDFSLSFASQEQMCKLLVCLALLTWFRLAIEALAYTWFNGEKGSGKSQAGIVWSMLSFLGKVISTNTSLPSIRNYAGYGASLMLDDAEKLTNKNDITEQDKRTLFLSGYRKGMTVDIQEKQGDNWITREISAYCPKAFSAIKLPDDVLGSRSIIIPLIRSIDLEKSNRDPMNTRLWPCNQTKLKDDLWLLALLHLKETVEISNELNGEDVLCGREYEKWKGILMIARLLERHGLSGFEAEVREIMGLYFKDEVSTITENELIPLIIEELDEMLKNEGKDKTEFEFSVKDLASKLTIKAREQGILSDEKGYYVGTIGKLLTSLRIPRIKKEKGNQRKLSIKLIEQLKKIFLQKKNSDTHKNQEINFQHFQENKVKEDSNKDSEHFDLTINELPENLQELPGSNNFQPEVIDWNNPPDYFEIPLEAVDMKI